LKKQLPLQIARGLELPEFRMLRPSYLLGCVRLFTNGTGEWSDTYTPCLTAASGKEQRQMGDWTGDKIQGWNSRV